MNSDIIIAGLSLCLVATFFVFRTQILILLNRLASVEFHFAENLRTRSKASTDDVHPWAWHKVWLNSFLHPNDGTWNRLLSEKSISFIRVCFWITLTSLSFPLVYSIVVWVKFPQSITTGNLLGSAKNILLIGIFEPIGFIAITGTIHVLAKLFGKGDYRNLFVVFATSYVPISLLHTFIALFKWSFASKAWLYASVLLNFYFIIFVSTEIIKFNYHTNRLVALLISIAVTATSYFVVYRIYCLTGLGI